MTTEADTNGELVLDVTVSQTIDRPVADVFEWYAADHHENHPRWDPDIEMEKETEGPIGVGTVIRRRNTRYDQPVEGTMRVIEYEPNEVFGGRIQEGPFDTRGRATFEELGSEKTRLTLGTEVPDSIDKEMIRQKMQRSAENIKELIESEQ